MARDLTFKLVLDSLGFQRGAQSAGDALKKLGSDVKTASGNMKPLGDQMGAFGTIIQKMSSPLGMTTMAIGAMGGAAIAAAIGVKQLAEYAEKLSNQSAKTGIGVEALQKYERAAKNAGISLETVVAAITKMQRSVGAGSGLEKLGVDLSKIKNLAPEKQFEEMARVFVSLKSQTDKAQFGAAAFGKSWADMVPIMEKVASGAADLQVALGVDQVQALLNLDSALDDLGGNWDDFSNQFLAFLGDSPEVVAGIHNIASAFNVLAATLKQSNLSSLTKTIWDNLKNFAAHPIDFMTGKGKYDFTTKYVGMDPSTLGLSMPTMPGTGALKDVENLKKLQAEQDKAAKAAQKHATELKKLEFAMSGMAFQLDQATIGLEQYLSTYVDDLADFGKGGKFDLTKTAEELNAYLGQGPEMGFTMVGTQVEYVKSQTIDWAQELQNAANILSSMGGILGDIGQTMAQVSAGIAGIQSGRATFSAGMQQGGLSGALGMLSGGLSIVSSAIGIGKAIVGLFKGDPVQKAAKEAGKAIGMKVSKEMANSFLEESKKTGKSVAQVAKEWMDGMRKELRTQGMGQMAEGVNTMMSLLGTSPEITRIAAGNFATLFWETVKDEGWVAASAAFADTFGKLKEFYGENMPASLQSIQGLMNLSQNSAVSPYLQAAQAQGQFVTGAMNAGIYSQGMQGDSTVIAKETIGQLKSNGATDEQAYQAIGSLLQANVNAALASGRGISNDLQALLDEARANGVDIVADINVQQLEVLRAIYSVLGGIGSPGSTSGASAPSSVPTGGGSDFSPTGDPIIPDRSTWKYGPDGPIPMADGGIVTKPTVALVGEAGPEAIVPLRRGGGGGGSHVTLSPTLVVDPLLSHEGRKDLVKFLLAEMDKGTRNNPYMNRMIRRGAVGGR